MAATRTSYLMQNTCSWEVNNPAIPQNLVLFKMYVLSVSAERRAIMRPYIKVDRHSHWRCFLNPDPIRLPSPAAAHQAHCRSSRCVSKTRAQKQGNIQSRAISPQSEQGPSLLWQMTVSMCQAMENSRPNSLRDFGGSG